VAQLAEALGFKSKGREFDSKWCHWNFSLIFLLFLWGLTAYTSGSTSALWLILLSPVLDVPTFSISSALPRPLSRENWSCNPLI
jgi:hypothetical protein